MARSCCEQEMSFATQPPYAIPCSPFIPDHKGSLLGFVGGVCIEDFEGR